MFGLEHHNHARESPFCVLTLMHMGSVNNSPYAERPEGSRSPGLLSSQTFGTVRNISN